MTRLSFYERYPSGRWWKHTSSKSLVEDYNKFGHDSFAVELEECGYSKDDLLILESIYICRYNSVYPNGYNSVYDATPCELDPSKKVFWVHPRLINWNPPCNGLNKARRKGTPLSEETKRKISLANTGKKRSVECRQRLSILRQKQVMSTAHIKSLVAASIKSSQRPVYQIDPKTDYILKEFDSATRAEQAMGLNGSGVGSVARGTQKTAAGFKWRFKDETN